MKIDIFTFTGTGNTLRASELLGEELYQLGHEVSLHSVKADFVFPGSDADLLVFAYPVHAFNAPKNFLKFLKKIPKGELPVCLLRTSGEPLKLNDASGITPRRILKKKGYFVQAEYSVVMPYNIIFRHSDGMAARMWLDAKIRMKKAASEITEKTVTLCKVGLFRRFVSFVLRIEHVAMPVLGRTFHAGKNCIGCGACVKLCPQNNIRMENGKPKFGGSCVGCMACAFGCPHDAMKISLLNGWRVNGKYDFSGIPATDEEVCSYCKKSYLRYFHETEAEKEAFFLGSNP